MDNQRLRQFQDRLKQKNIDLYYLNTSDYHMSEYVSEYFKTIAYFSNFTGSLATLLITQDDAYIFVDGRYHTQADKQCLPLSIKVVKLGTASALEPVEFIVKNYPKAIVGIDGKRSSTSFVKKLLKHNIRINSIDLYSDLITNRPPLKKERIYDLADKYTGLTRKKKIELVQYCLNGRCHIVNNLESIAYILNLRSSDILYTPVFYAYLVFVNKDVYLFCDKERFSEETLEYLYEDGIIIRSYDSYYEFLSLIKNNNILLDENKVNYETYTKINGRNNKLYNMRSLIEDMKSIKNNVEQENSKLAHIYDGIAMLRFLMWIDSIDKRTVNEYEVAKKIDEFRLSYKAEDISFNSIVAYNDNAAIIHYAPEAEKARHLDNKGILLLDTGGQYLQGTTDITRTIALGPVSDEIKKYFSLVLKAMFSLSEFKFLRGVNGNQLDMLARKDLWEYGVNYRHGTGHGVGYFLSVHEGPPNVRYTITEDENQLVEIKPGMIFSDEPGVYFENKFGIRCENLILCKKNFENEYGEFLKFETLTLVPFDLRLIDKNYLDEKTINALNNYHNRVYETLLPYLNQEEAEYLRRLTRSI